ncbi:MAG: hypothetical protein LBC87_12770 [Fibromonadaceae bacterium]|jgi:hypothetical protein|nr:hypothetical protein [Fibromonadaceae bacterium]
MAFFALLLLLFGYSFAQEPEAEAPSQPQPQQTQILSPQEIPQGFAAQLKAAQQAQQQEATAEPLKTEKKTETASQNGYHSYEAYLDSIELTARLLLPARLALDSMKYVINSQFGTEKNKQIKIENLEKQHAIKEKKMMDKLKSTIKLSQDIQPEWGVLLQKNENDINEYKKRMDVFKGKISDMNVMSARINSLLAKLQVDSSYIETLEKKNMLYVKRMERACELMQDYAFKEEAQVLSTERKKFPMTLGEYNENKGELQVNIKDFSSNIPFDYHGVIKMKQRQVETIDNETDGFTAIIDYINYPFVVDGVKMYPGAKKAHIYYEDDELTTIGAFKAIEGFDWREGYSQWATTVDSLLTGKLKYRNLDSSYAMKKVKVGPPFWTPKRIFRATAFVLSAASLGLGYWQNTQVKSKTQKANELYGETLKLAMEGKDASGHKDKAKLYDDEVKSLEKSQFARNGLYISAGAFGVAGIVSFFF